MVLRDGEGCCCLKNGDFQSCIILFHSERWRRDRCFYIHFPAWRHVGVASRKWDPSCYGSIGTWPICLRSKKTDGGMPSTSMFIETGKRELGSTIGVMVSSPPAATDFATASLAAEAPASLLEISMGRASGAVASKLFCPHWLRRFSQATTADWSDFAGAKCLPSCGIFDFHNALGILTGNFTLQPLPFNCKNSAIWHSLETYPLPSTCHH